MQRLVNEFIGTFFLVFTICVAAVYGKAGDYAPIAIGTVLVAVVYAGGHISKAHYNPAVSLAFLIRGCYISAKEMFSFMGVQFLGAVVAALLAASFFKGDMEVSAAEISIAPALVGEFLFTFVLVWVIMNVATAKAITGNQFYGIAIGFTVIAAIYSVGDISLAVLNPAVAAALPMVGKLSPGQIWIPIAGSISGAVAAVVIFNTAHPSEECSTSDDSTCRPIDEE